MISFIKKYFYNDYGILKIIFTSSCIFLLYEQFYKYLVLKPTLTQSGRRDLKEEDFPVMTICPIKHVDMTKLTSYGYTDLFQYKGGVQSNKTHKSLIGWAGNSNSSLLEVMTKISMLKSQKDCPYSKQSHVVFGDKDERQGSEILTFELTNALFPYHLCCKIIVPEEAKSSVLSSVQISFKIEEKPYFSFFLYLSDQVTYTQYQPPGNRMSGKDIIPAPGALAASEYYKVSLTEEEHLPVDPNYQCIDYKKPGKYNKCLENYFVEKSMKLLNCTPPYLTNNQV